MNAADCHNQGDEWEGEEWEGEEGQGEEGEDDLDRRTPTDIETDPEDEAVLGGGPLPRYNPYKFSHQMWHPESRIQNSAPMKAAKNRRPYSVDRAKKVRPSTVGVQVV